MIKSHSTAVGIHSPEVFATPRQRRRLLLDLALRRARPGTGSSEVFYARRTAVNDWPDLRALLSGLRWAIVGGVATRAYMPERSTMDLNILVHPDDANEVWQRLRAANWTYMSALAVPGQLWTTQDGIEVDILEGRFPWIGEALSAPIVADANPPVIALPYLVMLKMEASRTIDLGDLSRMLGLASDAQLAEVRRVVARFMPADRDDLETLIYLGQLEMKFPPSQQIP